MVVKMDGFDYFGRGVTKVNSKVCFVKNAQKGEIVEIKIVEEKKSYNVAEVVRYIKTSPSRVESPCPYYDACGGCHLGSMEYNASLKLKEEGILEELKRNSLSGFKYLGIVRGTPYHYRNKITLHSDGENLGFYKEGTHELVPIEKCLLADERINEMIQTLSKKKDIMLRVSNENDTFLTSDSKGSVISSIGTKKYRISPNSFFQVNSEVTKKLYDAIYQIVKKSGAKNVLDLYCGIGTIGIYICDLVKSVLGIEIVPEAIVDANYNKKLNQASNISFLCGDVTKYIKTLRNQYDLIIVDPPRKGIGKSALAKMMQIDAKTIIYVSCNKRTLIRDLKLLKEKYEIDTIQLFDMFPNTYHTECLCVLKSSVSMNKKI